VLRRTAPETARSNDVLERGGVRLDPDRFEVTVRGTEVRFTRKEFELLEYLMENAGRAVTRESLIDNIWGTDYFGDTRTLDVHVKRVRSKIEENPKDPKLVVTVRGIGYRFVA
jgi:two-component system response regulator RegX3